MFQYCEMIYIFFLLFVSLIALKVFFALVFFSHVNPYNINAINAAATIAGPNGK